MANLHKILESFSRIEQESLNAQQKSVKQLPALFKPQKTSPQLSGPYPGKNATQGYLVGEGDEMDEAVLGGAVKGGPRDAEDYEFKLKDLRDRISRATDVSTREYLKFALADLERLARERGIVDAQGKIKEGDETGYGSETGDSGADETPDGVSPDTQSFLNEMDNDNPVVNAITRRIMMQRTDLLSKYGPELIGDAIDEVAEFVGDVEEIGSSDVSGWVRQVEDYAKRMHNRYPEPMNVGDALDESRTTEDVISTVKKKLGDYLSDLSKEIKSDSDLKDKLPQDIDKITPAVKTITTDDGKEIKIHGNEDDGFRITIKDKQHSARFESLDHAVMACEMYCNRRRAMRETQQLNNDYLEER